MNLIPEKYKLLFYITITFILIISIMKWIDYLTKNKYIIECFTNGPIMESSNTSHTVNLPLTTQYSCKNFCGPTARCSVTGQQCLSDIDWQGTEQVKKIMPSDIVSVFILPPSINDLESRLKKRDEKNKELINQRMKMAKDEIKHWKDYKYIVVNKDVENCFEQITKIIKIERELRSTFN